MGLNGSRVLAYMIKLASLEPYSVETWVCLTYLILQIIICLHDKSRVLFIQTCCSFSYLLLKLLGFIFDWIILDWWSTKRQSLKEYFPSLLWLVLPLECWGSNPTSWHCQSGMCCGLPKKATIVPCCRKTQKKPVVIYLTKVWNLHHLGNIRWSLRLPSWWSDKKAYQMEHICFLK